jgi:hypothetical protein
VNSLSTNFADLVAGVGTKALRLRQNTAGQMGLAWDAVGTQTDVEVLAMVSLSRMVSGEGFGVTLRGSGTGTQRNAYFFVVTPFSGFQVIRRIGTGVATLNTFGSTNNSSRYWLRFRANGTDLKARAWVVGEAEPSAWGYETTDSNHASGWVGLYGQIASNDAPRYCDFISVDANGGTAPYPGASLVSGQWAEDFSSLSTGSPTGFTPEWNTATGTWDIVTDTPGVLPNKLTRIWRSTNNNTFTILDAAGATGGKVLSTGYGSITRALVVPSEETAFADQEIFATIASGAPLSTTTYWRSAIVARASGAALTGANGYVFGMRTSTGAPGRWVLSKYVNNAVTQLWNNNADEWSADTFYSVRMLVKGNTISVKWWDASTAEPSSWTQVVTDSSLTTGVPGLMQEYAAGATTYDLELDYSRWDVFQYQVPADSEGVVDAYLPPLSAELEGSAGTPQPATLDAFLPPLSAELTGTYSVVQDATLDASLPPLSAELEGRKQLDIDGTLDASLPPLSSEITGVFVPANFASLDANLPALAADLTGMVDAPTFATLDASLPRLDAELLGVRVLVQTATLDASLPRLDASLFGFRYRPVAPTVPFAVNGQVWKVMRFEPQAQPAPQLRRRFSGLVSTVATGPGFSRHRSWNVAIGPFDEEEAREVVADLLSPGLKLIDGFLVAGGLIDGYVEQVVAQSSDIRDLITVGFVLRERSGR